MINNIENLLPINFKNYKIEKILNEASLRKYYRLSSGEKFFILMDSSKEPKEFDNFLKVHGILSKVDVSIPNIYETNIEKKIILMEDFGKLRFDKILNNSFLKDILLSAANSLIVIKKGIDFDLSYKLPVYNISTFKNEISEFIDYFYPYYLKKNISSELREEFFSIWEKKYNLLDLNFTSFVHKDYNMNNLFYLPNKKQHYRCGIIDFQSAFWGEDCWDLFSLLEDSRIYFDDRYNDFFVKHFYSQSEQKISIEAFKEKYHFFNCSRQTRLLGRWVKLSRQFNQQFYLNFITITNQRLINNLKNLSMETLKNFYNKLIPDLYVC